MICQGVMVELWLRTTFFKLTKKFIRILCEVFKEKIPLFSILKGINKINRNNIRGNDIEAINLEFSDIYS